MSRKPVVLTNVLDIGGNPYLRLWGKAAVDAGVELQELTSRSVLARASRRPSWVHLQWPERAIRHLGRRASAEELARLLARVAIARARGARVMLTAHNVWSHDGRHPRLERVLWGALGALTTDLHVLSEGGAIDFIEAHPQFAGVRRRVIPHGHYGPLRLDAPAREQARDELGLPRSALVLVTFGLLKPYKGTEGLVNAFRALDDSNARLVVAGRIVDAALQRQLEHAAREDRRIVLQPRFLDDGELARTIRASDLVVLPYSRVLNSGSAMLALTLGRPVLVPRTRTFEELRGQVGGEWVSLFDGPLDVAALARVVRRPQNGTPDLAWCGWDRITVELSRTWADARIPSTAA